jgi:hypothetical protein
LIVLPQFLPEVRLLRRRRSTQGGFTQNSCAPTRPCTIALIASPLTSLLSSTSCIYAWFQTRVDKWRQLWRLVCNPHASCRQSARGRREPTHHVGAPAQTTSRPPRSPAATGYIHTVRPRPTRPDGGVPTATGHTHAALADNDPGAYVYRTAGPRQVSDHRTTVDMLIGAARAFALVVKL